MDQEQGNAPAEEPRALSDILTRQEPAERQAEPAGQPEPQDAAPQPETGEEPRQEQPRDDAGKFAPKAAVPPAAEKTPEHGLTTALKAERAKRQELEREIADIRARLTAPQAPPAQQQQQAPATPPTPLPDLLFQDPERFVQTFEQRQQSALLETRIAISEAGARQQYADYEQALAALDAYARSGARQQAEVAQLTSTDPAPAYAAYRAGKALLAQQRWQPVMQQHGDPDAFIAAEVERRVAERIAQQPEQPDPINPAPRLPTSLAGARASGPRSGPAWNGPPPLDAILGQRRRG